MKPFGLARWVTPVPSFGPRSCCLLSRRTISYSSRRRPAGLEPSKKQDDAAPKRRRGRPRKADLQALQSSVAAVATAQPVESGLAAKPPPPHSLTDSRAHTASTHAYSRASRLSKSSSPRSRAKNHTEYLPSPNPESSSKSAKLSALHSRLSLSSRIPIQTLARCLVDKTADPDSRFNNHNLSNLGNDLLGYWMSEHLVCHYPRLPMVVLTAATMSHVGPRSLTMLCLEWGVEVAAEPGGEVDPGLLQYRKTKPGTLYNEEVVAQLQQNESERTGQTEPPSSTLESASTSFVRAVVGAVYLHTGAAAAHEFFASHILSRHLNISSLFTFKQPTRDLSRLCAREGFEAPVARLISETGRLSRHPVFVVGVFSGRDKIGEDAGASLDEARFKAAAKALKGWYLYSPRPSGGSIMVPSAMEGEKGKEKTWEAAYVDDGEVIV